MMVALAVALPVEDWQFWIVTLLCAAAALWLVRGLLPIPALRRARRRRRGEKRAKLTISANSTRTSRP